MAKKTKTIARLLDDAAVLLQKIVRLKASDKNGICVCSSCGKKGHYKKMHGGHFIPRGKTATKIVEENIHPLCIDCNKYHAEEAKIGYTFYMEDMYGKDFTRELHRQSRQIKKYKRKELEGIIKEFREQIKELEERYE